MFNSGKIVAMDDWQLLNEYVTRNSEEAFRTLVDRHAGMVYHAALREVGNAGEAQEITQAVFIALARKASRIPRQTVLYGWLFRATRFAILNLRRDEACRRRHEQDAITMQTTLGADDGDSVWEQISPHLNDALDGLSQSDREVVMIRFFGNKSHKEVAQTLGVSEDTAKKRLSRALERLRMIFARRGVVVPSIVLAAALSAHGAQAAPVGLTASVAAAALAKGVAATPSSFAIAKGILKWIAWAKAKTALVVGTGVLLAAGTATVLVKGDIGSGDDVMRKLERQSGKRIVWDRHLVLPAVLDLEKLPLEQALDQLSVAAGAYWTIDYAVYDSEAALRQLVTALEDGAELQTGGWTNLSSRELRPSVSIQAHDPHGRSRAFVRMNPDNPDNQVAMTVVLGPEASAKWSQEMAKEMRDGQAGSGMRPPAGGPFQVVSQAMRDGSAEGVLAPERLLAESRLAPKINVSLPSPAAPETAARIAKAAQARWTTIYTLRRSPVSGAGIKLVHAGMGNMYGPPKLPFDQPGNLIQGMQSNRFNLTPEDRAAHDRAVAAFKQRK
jgi:RNA polymerase sigma factor (sigma-70 family)